MDTALGLIIVLSLYFLPTIIAARRGRQLGSVGVINLLLGWTVIGWVVALAIAASDRPARTAQPG